MRTELRGWFFPDDIKDLWRGLEDNLGDMRESIDYVHGLVREEAEVVGWGNVVLGGMSLGCATGLLALLTLDLGEEGTAPLGGFVGICGWLPFEKGLRRVLAGENKALLELSSAATPFACPNNPSAANVLSAINSLRTCLSLPALSALPAKLLATPVHIQHGLADDVILPRESMHAADVLGALGMEVEVKTYEGLGHFWGTGEGVEDIISWVKRVVLD